MVWNPTASSVETTVLAPLYYAGLSAARGVTAVRVSREGNTSAALSLGANDTVALKVKLEPRSFTWFVITE
jgi:hypothetical protein